MVRIQDGKTVPASPGVEASRIVISQHNGRDNGFCTHLEVMREGQEPFMVGGRYGMTLDEAEADARGQYDYLIWSAKYDLDTRP